MNSFGSGSITIAWHRGGIFSPGRRDFWSIIRVARIKTSINKKLSTEQVDANETFPPISGSHFKYFKNFSSRCSKDACFSNETSPSPGLEIVGSHCLNWPITMQVRTLNILVLWLVNLNNASQRFPTLSFATLNQLPNQRQIASQTSLVDAELHKVKYDFRFQKFNVSHDWKTGCWHYS